MMRLIHGAPDTMDDVPPAWISDRGLENTYLICSLGVDVMKLEAKCEANSRHI